MQLASPVSVSEFRARLQALNIGDRFAIAVSGGRDSMALARLCADYVKSEGSRVVALIVDHGLRDGSSAEAAQAKTWCEALGLEARILAWRGPKPQSGVQVAARAARYFLMAEAANELGVSTILTAHSADDQIETMLMRLARGAGLSGLASMEDETRIAAGAGDPVRLARPLLPFSRDALTATVKAYDQDYIDDPSNDDQRYERVRIRRVLSTLHEDGGLDRDALLQTAQRLRAEKRRRLIEEEHAFRRMGGVFTRWGGASFDVASLIDCGPFRDGAIARTVRAVSGADHAPDDSEIATHVDVAVRKGAAAIGGALFKRSGARLWVLREPAAILGRAGVPPLAAIENPAGAPMLWDSRFIFTAEEAISVRPLGEPGLTALGASAALIEAPVEAILGAPGLFRRDRLIGAPGLLFREGLRWTATPLAEERFAGGIIRFSPELTNRRGAHGAGLS